MESLAVLTSGGDAPGMNAAVRAVVRKGIHEGLRVYGVYHGYDGLLRGDLEEMDLSSVSDIIHRGGTVLHTARSEGFMTPEGRQRAYRNLRDRGIEALVVIGGDGSFRGALTFYQETGLPVVGVPGTIDNDIYGTDLTIGFDTAVNTVIWAINSIRDTATSHERTFIIEVMGRDSGFIALSAGVAGGAESILIPEIPVDYEDVCRRLMRGFRRGKSHSLIVVAEGAASGFKVAEEIERRTGLDTRISVLGYIQRGGTPTAMDRELASIMGCKAIDWLLAGQHACMTAYRGRAVVPVPFEECLSKKKGIDREVYELATILAL